MKPLKTIQNRIKHVCNDPKVPTNSHHATSHANMSTFANTPINRKTFTSATVNGSSSRIDSDKKYKYRLLREF